MLPHLPCLLFAAAGVLAQNATYYATSTLNPATTDAVGSTVTNADTFATTLPFNLQDLWNIFVGPVSSADITTTVSPTPVPSSSLIPPPFLHYPSFPPGREVPLVTKNESWSFPKHFFLGVAGAAYQMEGAAQAEGKGPSIWDVLTHRVTGWVTGNATADVTDNHYYLYKQDIARLAAIGVTHYSFSISWSRIFPFGTGPVNQLGIDHYNDVINTCLQYNITPMATLYHWDTPLVLENKYGGFLSEQIVDDFVEYARLAYRQFGDRVKYWFTVNEPHSVCSQYYPLPADYFDNFSIPAEHQKFICAKNILLSHAAAYRLGKQMLNSSLITYKNDGGYKIPATNSSADAEAVQRAWDFAEGWFADPVFLTGDFPSTVKSYTDAFLPALTPAQRELVNGSADYFAHDGYAAAIYSAPDAGIAACLSNPNNTLYPLCFNSSLIYPQSGWAIGAAADPLASSWLSKATDWVPALLRAINTRWHPKGGIAISEFGFAEPFESYKTDLPSITFDAVRTSYFHDYMEGILIALSEGINVLGCVAWSFMDNLEWRDGYSVRFGMQYVNYTTQERHYKASFFEYVAQYQKYIEK